MHNEERDGHPPHVPGYTLMFAGQRTAKTALLRLVVDSLDVAPSASDAQVAGLARFISSAQRPTASVRSVMLDVLNPLQREPPTGSSTGHASATGHSYSGLTHAQTSPSAICLSLIDTPALEASDPVELDRGVGELLGLLDARYRATLADESALSATDQQVHLCIYLLDPDNIVPVSTRERARRDSAVDELEEFELDNSSTQERPTVPLAELRAIRRLSKRVNVLPVLARADTLTSERLEAVKRAVMRDLAREGLGFGIFDPANIRRVSPSDGARAAAALRRDSSNIPLLPYALVTPDVYAYGDGVQRAPIFSHDQLVARYSPDSQPHEKLAPGRMVRRYKWGVVDALDPTHCDFASLREAVFTHMQALKKYTHVHLYAAWKSERGAETAFADPEDRKRSHLLSPSQRHASLSSSYGQSSAIDRRMSPSDLLSVGPFGAVPPGLYIPGTSQYNLATGLPGVPKVRQKKITVACNFCRTRKLKCDGGRPACAQCIKRSNPCDYQPVIKRRGMAKSVKDEDEDGVGPSSLIEQDHSPHGPTQSHAETSRAPFTSAAVDDEQLEQGSTDLGDRHESSVKEILSHAQETGDSHDRYRAGMRVDESVGARDGLPSSDRGPAPLSSSNASTSPALHHATVLPSLSAALGSAHQRRSHMRAGSGSFGERGHTEQERVDFERVRQRVHYERDREREHAALMDRVRGRELDKSRERDWIREGEQQRAHDRSLEREPRAVDWERERDAVTRQLQRPQVSSPHIVHSPMSHPRQVPTTPVDNPRSRQGQAPTDVLPSVALIGVHRHDGPQHGLPRILSINGPPHPFAMFQHQSLMKRYVEGRGHADAELPSENLDIAASGISTPDQGPTASPTSEKKKTSVRRAGSNYGPKTVACNFCRTRKTKCDGQHPKCGNCEKRSLACEYLEDQRRRAVVHDDPDGAGHSVRLKKLAPAPAVHQMHSISPNPSSSLESTSQPPRNTSPPVGMALTPQGDTSSLSQSASYSASPSTLFGRTSGRPPSLLSDETAFSNVKRKSGLDEPPPQSPPVPKRTKLSNEGDTGDDEPQGDEPTDDTRPRAVTSSAW